MRFRFTLRSNSDATSTLRLSLFFSVLLLLGIIAGVLTATFLNLSSKQAVFSDINAFIYTNHAQASPIVSFWQISRIPLLVLCLSFTCFGVVAIPISVVLQGYLLSFSVSAMVRLLGWQGALLGAASFGIRTLTIIPCLIILSVQCFLLSKQFFQTMLPTADGRVKFPRGFVLALVSSLILLPIGAVLDFSLTARAVSLVLNHLIF